MSRTSTVSASSVLALSLASAACLCARNAPAAAEATDSLVREALQKSVLLFDANRSGPEAGEGNAFPWRRACFVHDGEAIGRDLSGGFHDSGDHVKFGLPQASSAARLALAFELFREAFDPATERRILAHLRHFADYLMKTVESPNVIYHQVGDADFDHAYWGRPEDQEAQPQRRGGRPRPLFKDTGADVAGCAAAYLALLAGIVRETDAPYAARCLGKAREAFEYAEAHRTTTTGKGAFGRTYYASSDWRDDFALAGAALFLATGERTYVEKVERLGLPLDSVSPPHWDSSHSLAYYLLFKATGKEKYREALSRAVESHLRAVRPNGLAFYDDHTWGTLRYSTGMAFSAAICAREFGGSKYRDFVRGQVEYLLGRNEFGLSFMIGVGARWPQHPHHRASHTSPSDPQNRMLHELTGAMVGGPEHLGDARFAFRDSVENYISSEVSLDYQANCVGALAGLIAIEKDDRPAAGKAR